MKFWQTPFMTLFFLLVVCQVSTTTNTTKKLSEDSESQKMAKGKLDVKEFYSQRSIMISDHDNHIQANHNCMPKTIRNTEVVKRSLKRKDEHKTSLS